MAVSENDLLVGPLAPANGVTLISLDFFFENASDLQVFKSGSTDPLTIVTDYTVTLPSGPGLTDGSITLTTPANGTDRYSIYLVPPIQRSSDLQFRGGFQAGPVNLELDRLWRAVQALDTALERTFRFTQTGDVPARLNVETAAQRVNQLIGFTADGTGLTLIAIFLLISHGLPMETVGQPFDPTKMKAVAVEESDTLPHNTVIEELAAGYFHKGEVLKFAEVKITSRKGDP